MLTPFIQLYGSGHVHGLQHNGNALLDFERDALHRETGRTLQGSGDHTLTIRRRWDALGRLQALASQGLQRHITHTVYEPETFTPLVQLSAKASAQARPHALMLAVHGDGADGGDDEGSAQMAQMLQALPGDMRHLLDRNIRQAAREGLPEHILALMPDQGESALRSARNMRKQLEKQEQSQRTEITVRHYHCDHLGTPIALTDEKQNIVWAARLDPWGNVQEEFNPDNIEQSIRLPGQHQDKDTGLYYNRHRYYDPSIGAYVNQDPIGLMGGANHYGYPNNPNDWIDPTGLRGAASARLPPRVQTHNQEMDPHRQMRREFPFEDPFEQLKKLPSNKPRCETICPNEGLTCKPIPKNSLPAAGQPGCYQSCSHGPFMETRSPTQQTPLPTSGHGSRKAGRGDWMGFWKILRGGK